LISACRSPRGPAQTSRMAASSGLPTLLSSRCSAPRPSALKCPGTPQKPPATFVKEAPRCPEDHAVMVCVHNTFIEYRELDLASPLAEEFGRVREALSCPASRVGRFASLFCEVACELAGDAVVEEMPPSPVPWRFAETPEPEEHQAGLLVAKLHSSKFNSAAAEFVPGQGSYHDEDSSYRDWLLSQHWDQSQLLQQQFQVPFPHQLPSQQLPLQQLLQPQPQPMQQPPILEAGSRIAAGDARGVFGHVASVMMPAPPMAPPVMPSQGVSSTPLPPQRPPTSMTPLIGFACQLFGEPPCGPPPFSPSAGCASPPSEPSAVSLPAVPPAAVVVASAAAPSCPAPGTAELPSLGSYLHRTGDCKPCAFLHTKGCENGLRCQFCHLCEPGEKKRRQKDLAGERVTTVKKPVSIGYLSPVFHTLPLVPQAQGWYVDALMH